MDFISCVKWIRRGAAKSIPDKVQLTIEELRSVCEARKVDLRKNSKKEVEKKDDTKRAFDEYNFEDYDDEPDVVFQDDTLISLDPAHHIEVDDEDDSDKEDEILNSDDNLIAVGHVEQDLSILEVYVYNEENNDLYVHHDLYMETLPMCIEWLNFEPSDPSPGNLIAVGGLHPEISVWDLDIMNCTTRAFQLGKVNKRKRTRPEKQDYGHEDGVLDISWNENIPHILASASVDESVIVWDLECGKIGLHLKEFDDKVQCIKWHPTEPQTIITGSFDKFVRMFDCRVQPVVSIWPFLGEIERVIWNPSPSHSWEVIIGSNDGLIHCMDCRNNRFIWDLQAHEKEVTGLSLHHMAPEILTTCSTDGLLKVWDISKDKPSLLLSKAQNSGELHCLDVNPDLPHVVCTGGSKKSHLFSVTDLHGLIPDNPKDYWGQKNRSSKSSPLAKENSSNCSEMCSSSPVFSTTTYQQSPRLTKHKKKKKGCF